MRKTSFFGLNLPEYTDDADIEQLNAIFSFLESVHKDSVNFYKSAFANNLITLTSNGNVYPKEYVDNLCMVWSSPTDLNKGQANIKLKVGTVGRGVNINAEVMNTIKAGDFCFSKYYLAENKFKITSYFNGLETLSKDITNIRNELATKTPSSRKINGKPLTSDINLSAANVGALPSGGKSVDSSKLNGISQTSSATKNTIMSRDGGGSTSVNSLVCNSINLGGVIVTIEK